jgi:FixJ family two-component response regulator
MTETLETEAIVFVVDDDPSMRKALSNLFRSVGLRAEVFGSAREWLENKLPEVASCLVRAAWTFKPSWPRRISKFRLFS